MASKTSNRLRILLVLAVLVLINFIASKWFFRLDFTADQRYTLSDATKDILADLDDPVTVDAYFSEDMPTQIDKAKQDFEELLVEYKNRSGGNIEYQFINPNVSQEKEREVQQEGIMPISVQARERDQITQKRAYLGAVLKYGDNKEVIPVIQPGAAMEYSLSSSIKKIAISDKPKIGLVQGHGEPGLEELQQAKELMDILYVTEPADLNDAELATKYQSLIIVAPKDSFSVAELNNLENYWNQGRGVVIALNRVDVQLQQASAVGNTTGLEGWLAQKGVLIDENLVLDAKCGNITVQQNMGIFSIPRPVKFPYLPQIQNFAEHPITNGLEDVSFIFASTVAFAKQSDAQQFTSLVRSSGSATIEGPPFAFDIDRQWTQRDFPQRNLTMGGLLEDLSDESTPKRMVIFGDGDFVVNGSGQQAQGQKQDNLSLFVNAVDYVSGETGLNELRTKTVMSRPIEKELTDGKRQMIKMLNFALPIGLIVLYGILRYSNNRRKRRKWMDENYA